MDKPKKRMGRPTKPPVEGERISLGLRVTADAKRKLEAAAVANGRSLSQEAELRIERSFATDSIEKAIAEQGRAVLKVLQELGRQLIHARAGEGAGTISTFEAWQNSLSKSPISPDEHPRRGKR